jgi:Arc/MetJ-type ribon-helix-helix transcriptional regulator
MTEQLAIRIPRELMESMDDLVAQGRFSTRTELVRTAVVALVEQERRRAIGEAIARGYRRVPQTDEDLAEATARAIRSIHEEPW